ncbi:MAG TPA: PhzF family phenazine biosynthesis protein [Candidatus Polarisedimenticolia bacterium]
MNAPPEGRSISILQVDAFTTRPFAGNPAGVVLEPGDLGEDEMLLIAREMNLSETAFLLPPSGPEADLRVRWMTPAAEVDLCGHATVATFHAALEEGRLAPGAYRMECRAGVLPIDLRRDETGWPVVRLGLPVPALEETNLAACRIAEPLGIETDDLSGRLPLMRTGEWLLAPLSGLDAMRRVRPDLKALLDLHEELGLGSTIVLTTETLEPGSAVHVRMFAPGFGIDEDPVTGSAEGPVAAYLVRHGLLEPSASTRYIAEQGDIIGRPGRIEVEVTREAGRIRSITIAGHAVTVLRGTISLPRDR